MPRSTTKVTQPTRITKSLSFTQVHITERLRKLWGPLYGNGFSVCKVIEGDYYGFCRLSDMRSSHD